jgi:hypothetical protein
MKWAECSGESGEVLDVHEHCDAVMLRGARIVVRRRSLRELWRDRPRVQEVASDVSGGAALAEAHAKREPYPSRSTVAGSSRAARRAGTHAASKPTATSAAAVPAKVVGSRDSTWKSKGAMNRAAHQLPARPSASPATMRRPI